jgi:hypothetical protein
MKCCFKTRKPLSIFQVIHQITLQYEGVWKPRQDKIPIVVLNPNIYNSIAWGFFDGVSQDKLVKCGIGGVLLLTQDHKIIFKDSLGEGTNN